MTEMPSKQPSRVEVELRVTPRQWADSASVEDQALRLACLMRAGVQLRLPLESLRANAHEVRALVAVPAEDVTVAQLDAKACQLLDAAQALYDRAKASARDQALHDLAQRLGDGESVLRVGVKVPAAAPHFDLKIDVGSGELVALSADKVKQVIIDAIKCRLEKRAKELRDAQAAARISDGGGKQWVLDSKLSVPSYDWRNRPAWLERVQVLAHAVRLENLEPRGVLVTEEQLRELPQLVDPANGCGVVQKIRLRDGQEMPDRLRWRLYGLPVHVVTGAPVDPSAYPLVLT